MCDVSRQLIADNRAALQDLATRPDAPCTQEIFDGPAPQALALALAQSLTRRA
uniref:Uncharacterized protein n=1 Tax=Streptomyces sp. NBC_00049 TaxID=2903617 RepID=A0AAU2K0A4_9ACTN